MSYKIRRYNNFKRRFIFETYEPKPKLNITKDTAMPVLIKVGHILASWGGFFSLIFSGIVLSIKGFFGVKKRLNKYGKFVEVRIKK